MVKVNRKNPNAKRPRPRNEPARRKRVVKPVPVVVGHSNAVPKGPSPNPDKLVRSRMNNGKEKNQRLSQPHRNRLSPRNNQKWSRPKIPASKQKPAPVVGEAAVVADGDASHKPRAPARHHKMRKRLNLVTNSSRERLPRGKSAARPPNL